MKILIVDDEPISRLVLKELLKPYGPIDLVANGNEAVDAAADAIEAGEPYELICLDIMMPVIDGHTALKLIRSTEEEKGISSSHGSKIFMISALSDMKNAMTAFQGLCDAYLVKPITKAKLVEKLHEFRLISSSD